MRRAGFLALVVVLLAARPTGASAADSERAKSQRRASQAAARLAQAEAELARLEDSVAAIRARVNTIEARTQGLRDQVRAYAIHSYVGDPVAFPRLFTMRDANEFGRAQVLADLALGNARGSLGRYRAEREDLADQLEQLEEREAARSEGLADLRRRRAEAQAEVERLARAEQEAAARAAREAREREARERARARAQERPATTARPAPVARPAGTPAAAPAGAPAAAPAAGAGGGWVCPVQGPRAFSNDYGARRAGGRSHQGNDILAPRGTPVVANVSGTVSRHSNRLGGLAYYLKGDDGITYYGAHLDSYGAQGRVSAGTQIGTVGTTGDAVGGPPHLHFEMHPGGGGAINPYSTLVKHC